MRGMGELGKGLTQLHHFFMAQVGVSVHGRQGKAAGENVSACAAVCADRPEECLCPQSVRTAAYTAVSE